VKPRSFWALAFLPCIFAPGCAQPCVDDGVLQQMDQCAAAEATESESADGTSAASDATVSATSSAGTDASQGEASADTTAGDASSSDDADSGDTEGDPHVVDFPPGTLVIPMDVDYQDTGMLEAFGLVYELLRNDIAINWIILAGKGHGDVDFSASAEDLATGTAIEDHGYRGGPFVIDADLADAALPIIETWQAANPDTTVHRATAEFSAYVARRLLTAPTIAVFADGNEDIARSYLLAAKIPDSTGDATWPADSPDLLDVAEIAGPSLDVHDDGALFGADGQPSYCQLMSMHWAVQDAEANPEVVAEVRSFLAFDTHFFAECQAVNAFENLVPHGFFLTPNGFEISDQPDAFDYFRMDTAFGQIDGPFAAVGGSEPSYSLPAGDAYYQSDTVIITASGSPEGVQDVWMTGFLDGACPATAEECPGAGKVSYLGGHQYDTALPISQHATTQGARLFLNSLFEAPCAIQADAAPGRR
jgi:hypothetical protein